MTTDDGVVNDRLHGANAKAAIARYIAWVESHKDGVFESAEAAGARRQIVNDHINAIRQRIEKAKRVVVYMM
jgi:hypothetical protein